MAGCFSSTGSLSGNPPTSVNSHCCSCHVLDDIMVICAREEILSANNSSIVEKFRQTNCVQVEQSLLLNYLSDLEAYRMIHVDHAHSTLGLLDLLLNFVRKTYTPIRECHPTSSAVSSGSPNLPLSADYDFLTLSEPVTKIVERFDSTVAKASWSGGSTVSDTPKYGDEGWEPILFDLQQTATIQLSYLRPLNQPASFIETSSYRASPPANPDVNTETLCETYPGDVSSGTSNDDRRGAVFSACVDSVEKQVIAELKGRSAWGGILLPCLSLAKLPNTPKSTPVPFDYRQAGVKCFTCQLPTSLQDEVVQIAQVEQPTSDTITTKPPNLARTSKDAKHMANEKTQQDDVTGSSTLELNTVDERSDERPCVAPAAASNCRSTSANPITLQDLECLFLKLLENPTEHAANAPENPRLDDTRSKEVAGRASLLDFKEIDEIWDDKAYRYTILESPKPKSVDNLDQYVFVVRARVDKKTKETTYFVDVKSLMLRDVLRGIFRDVPGISIMEEKLSIEQKILYNFLPEIESCRDEIDPENQASKEHVSLLIDHIKKSHSDLTQRLGALLKAKEITYDLLWALFKANTLVYTTCQGTMKPRCFKYESATEETTLSGVEYFHIKGSYLDFDGKIFGMVPIEAAILKFVGSKPVNSLETFPLSHHEDEEGIKKKLIECGRRFCALKGTQHRQYYGTAFQMVKGKPRRITINGRIMVDPVKFLQDNPNYAGPSIVKSSKSVSIWLDLDDVPSTQLDELVPKQGITISELSDEVLLVCSPTVLGYSLENKLYLEFAVADISEICWDESIFSQLKIASKSKELIQALTTQHSSRENVHGFDDFVKAKGLGLIILLYGPPGVGKTMTAEALAELLHMPLFTVSAANLSHTSSSDLDMQLSKIFDVASHWNALLLLDEADSYLRQRSNNSQHNALVSVFLRKLEYFSGIMILTTNQVKEFDHAVQSRIHIGLAYSSLGADTRMSIWKGFLTKPNTKGSIVNFTCTELQNLAERKLNGRQIKNAVRAAHALADFEKVDLAMHHLHKVLDIGTIFENDFKGNNGMTYI